MDTWENFSKKVFTGEKKDFEELLQMMVEEYSNLLASLEEQKHPELGSLPKPEELESLVKQVKAEGQKSPALLELQKIYRRIVSLQELSEILTEPAKKTKEIVEEINTETQNSTEKHDTTGKALKKVKFEYLDKHVFMSQQFSDLIGKAKATHTSKLPEYGQDQVQAPKQSPWGRFTIRLSIITDPLLEQEKAGNGGGSTILKMRILRPYPDVLDQRVTPSMLTEGSDPKK